MRTKNLALVLLTLTSFGMACSKDSKKSKNDKGSEIKLKENSEQYQGRVVPNDFVNTKGSLGETKNSLADQVGSVKGPGAQLGIDGTSTPNQVVTRLTAPGLMSRSVRSLLNARESIPQTPPQNMPQFPSQPPMGAGEAKKNTTIDMTSCESFFGNVDQVIDSALKGVKSSLAQVNEEDIVKAKGVTVGQKAPNEAFNYRITAAENGSTMAGTFSGGANDTSAFVKGTAKFGGTFTMQTDESQTEINPEEVSGGQQLSARPAPTPKPSSEPVNFTGQGVMSASVFVDSALSMLKVGGGLSLDGKLGNDPVNMSVATYVELAGGKSPKIAVDLEADGSGKMPGSTESTKVTSNFHLSMAQNAEMGIHTEVKSAGSYTNGSKVEPLGFTIAADFNVIKGQCVVQNVTCSADQAESCKSIEGWKAE